MWMSILRVIVLIAVSRAPSAMHLLNLHSRMIAIAINTMSTWWKPRNGTSPGRIVSVHSFYHRHVVLTLHANGELEVRHCVCLSSLVVLEWVFGSLRPQRAGREVRKNALRRWLMVVSHSKNV